jgi:hypothetical protein
LVALSEVERHVSQWVIPADSKRNMVQETRLTLWNKGLLQKLTVSQFFENLSPFFLCNQSFILCTQESATCHAHTVNYLIYSK